MLDPPDGSSAHRSIVDGTEAHHGLSPRFLLNEARVDLEAGTVRVDGHTEGVEPRVADLLALLVAERSRVVSKEEIVDRVWGGREVSPQAITVAMSQLRRALGDDSRAPRFIETVPGVGYRLTASYRSSGPDRSPSDPTVSSMRLAFVTVAAVSAIAVALALAPSPSSDRMSAVAEGPASVTSWTEQRVTSSSPERPVLAAVVSPDGATLAYVDDRGVRLRRLATGDERLLVAAEPGVGFDGLDWFPQGDRLVVSRVDTVDSSVHAVTVTSGEMRRLSLDASDPSVAPDGESVAFVRSRFDEPTIWLWAADGSERQLAGGLVDGMAISAPLEWTPDGGGLAYLRGGGARSPGARVELIELGSAHEPSVLLDDSRLRSLLSATGFAWLSPGRFVYSLADEGGGDSGVNLWMNDFDPASRELAGRPIRITSWTGQTLESISSLGDGRGLGVVRGTTQEDVWVATRGDASATFESVRRLTLDARNDYAGPWITDEVVTFHSERRGVYDLFQQAVDASDPDPLRSDPGDEFVADLTPDGEALLFFRAEPDSPSSDRAPTLMMRTFSDGAVRSLGRAPTGGVQCGREVGSGCVAFERDGGATVVTRFDPSADSWLSGERIRFEATLDWAEPALSPDGNAIAFPTGAGGSIEIFSLIDAPTRMVELSGLEFVEEVAWSTRRPALFVTAPLGSWSERASLVAEASLDGAWERRLELPHRIYGLRVAPSELHLALTVSQREANFWIVAEP